VLRSTAGSQPVSQRAATTAVATNARITSELNALRSNDLVSFITAHANLIFSPDIVSEARKLSNRFPETSASPTDKHVL